jgi:hypothetical protein
MEVPVVTVRISCLPRVRARSKELLDRAIASTVVAIEIYNKPDFSIPGGGFRCSRDKRLGAVAQSKVAGDARQ